MTAVFELNDGESSEIEEDLGTGVLTNREVEVSSGYSGTLTCGTKLDVEKGVEHITADVDAHAADRMVIDPSRHDHQGPRRGARGRRPTTLR